MTLNLPLDDNLAASIHRRRIAEVHRKQRIFDSKRRQIGIDVKALNQQMNDSLFNRTREEELEKKFAEQVMNNDRLALLYEQQKADELRKINKKIDNCRLSVQRPEYRRDYDLYDPEAKKKERPPRLSMHDHCPVSSIQKMEGEDLNSKYRTQKQREQFRDILLQQMQEKRLQNFKKDRDMQEWEKNLLNQDRHALFLTQQEAYNYRKAIEHLKTDNKMLALQNVERRMQDKIREEMDNKKDIEHNFYGPLLSETPGITPDAFKGMSKEQVEAIRQEQLKQMAEKQRQREREGYEKAAWDQTLINQHKLAALLDEEEKRERHRENKNLECINLGLSQEQKLCKEFMDKVVFRNKVTDDYYAQFNTTTR